MREATIYLSLGTNLGNRLANLVTARQALQPLIRVNLCSSIYQTAPWGVVDQPDFLNQVLKASTRLHPQGLLARLKSIEVEMGRVPASRYGPRLIDMDILLYSDLVIDHPVLTIPHPRLVERAFVLVPLAEIAPSLRHPITGECISELLARVDCQGVARFQPAT